jgi:hypothetical protein
MDAFKYIGITIAVVLAETLIFAGYVVAVTRSTDSLAVIGQMVAQIVASFMLR